MGASLGLEVWCEDEAGPFQAVPHPGASWRPEGRPARLSGRGEVMRHVAWFLGAVENFRFFDVRLYAFADPEGAVAEVKAEGLIKPTGRIYRQDYVVFLRAVGGKIVFLREYFDPVRAAKALDTPILGLES